MASHNWPNIGDYVHAVFWEIVLYFPIKLSTIFFDRLQTTEFPSSGWEFHGGSFWHRLPTET